MNNKDAIKNKLKKIAREKGQKIIISIFLLSIVLVFIYALGYATNYWVTVSSGTQITNVTINGGSYVNLAELHTSDHANFYTPMQEVNRFILIMACSLLVLYVLGGFSGNKNRKKYYLANFIFGFSIVGLTAVLSIIAIGKITHIDELWESVTYDLLLDADGEPIYSDIYYRYISDVDDEHFDEYQIGVKKRQIGEAKFTFSPVRLSDIDDINARKEELGLSPNDFMTDDQKLVYFDDVSSDIISNYTSVTYTSEGAESDAVNGSGGTYYYGTIIYEDVMPSWLRDVNGLAFRLANDADGNLVYAPQKLVSTVYDDEFFDGIDYYSAKLTVSNTTILNNQQDFVPNDNTLNFGYGIFSFAIITSMSYAACITYKLIKQSSKYIKKEEVAENE